MSPLTGKLKAQLKNEKNDQLKSNFLFLKISYIHRLIACVYNTFLDILDLYLSAFFFSHNLNLMPRITLLCGFCPRAENITLLFSNFGRLLANKSALIRLYN